MSPYIAGLIVFHVYVVKWRYNSKVDTILFSSRDFHLFEHIILTFSSDLKSKGVSDFVINYL